MTDSGPRIASMAVWTARPGADPGVRHSLLASTFDDVFGLEMLQLGTWGVGRELLAPHASAARASWRTRPTRARAATWWPVLRTCRSIMRRWMRCCCRIPSSCVADPYAVLREADRVLVAEGQLIVLGFRPASLWGLRAAASRAGFPPGLRRNSASLAGARLAGAAQLRDRDRQRRTCTACRGRHAAASRRPSRASCIAAGSTPGRRPPT